MVLSIRPESRWITEYYSMEVISEKPDGTVLAEFYTRDPQVAARLALRLGPGMGIVEGEAGRRALTHLAAAVLDRYKDPAE